MNKKVLVGMSGGVDSSVTAYLLKKNGYDVTGAIMKLCNDNEESFLKSVHDAKNVCDTIGIDLLTLDFCELFRQKVVTDFISEYEAGRTPNPCVVCNKYLKFGAFLDYALSHGMDYVATGHYSKVIFNGGSGLYEIHMSEYADKDQTYMMYNQTQHTLSHTLMPLGDYSKDNVRNIAREIGLDVADKKDSQEICFVPDGEYAEYIEEKDDYKPIPGNFVDVTGNVIGQHKGIIYYTIGQRKGIGAYGRPMFVMKIDKQTNTIVLGEKGMEYSDTLICDDVHFISGAEIKEPITVTAKHRYKARPSKAVIFPIENNSFKVVFHEPQRAVTPGQSVVFYNGDVLLGGGVIR